MPMHLEYSTTGKCKPQHVWQKFEKLEEWGWWNPVVGQTRWLEGEPWGKGSRFLFQLMKPKVMTFKPVLIESAPPHRLAWIGGAPGFKGVHWFSFEEQPDGTTLLKTWEDSSGVVTLFFGAGMRGKLLAMHREWLEALKTEAEKIAREEYARS